MESQELSASKCVQALPNPGVCVLVFVCLSLCGKCICGVTRSHLYVHS